MSKSKRNYREPREIFDLYGADALRWYFFANQAPWTSIRYSEQAIKDSIPRFLLTLWNCYSFFVIYATSGDDFDPAVRINDNVGQLTPTELSRAVGYRAVTERRELDRWILSELHRTTAAVIEQMDAYDNYGACQLLDAFVDNLSNWYVRRSRPRFWSKEYESTDKLDAYWTLYECLLTTCKLIAPFVPFLAETLWQNLAGVFEGRAAESVHLCDYPTPDASLIDVLQKCRQPFNANAVAQAGALAGLRDTAHQAETKRVTDAGRTFLEDAFASRGVGYVPSSANFVLARVGDGDAVFQALMRRGVIGRGSWSGSTGRWRRCGRTDGTGRSGRVGSRRGRCRSARARCWITWGGRRRGSTSPATFSSVWKAATDAASSSIRFTAGASWKPRSCANC